MDDEAVCNLVRRLSRPHRSGGDVIERAAILAEGGDSAAVMAWITAHAGEPEDFVPATSSRGIHGARHDIGGANARMPLRYVLPAGALARAPG